MNFPKVRYGDDDAPIDWRGTKDETGSDDEDLPASDSLIDMLGLDPDDLQPEL